MWSDSGWRCGWLLLSLAVSTGSDSIVSSLLDPAVMFGRLDSVSPLKGSMDEWLDKVISGVDTKAACPIHLPSYNASFHTEILVVPLMGTFVLSNGVVSDISTLVREGEATASYDGTTLTLSAAVLFKDIKFSGDFVATLEALGPSGSLSGSLDQLKLEAVLLLDVQKVKATVKDFYMTAGSVDLNVSVLPVLDWFLDTLIKLIVFIIKWPLMSVISSDLKGTLQQTLDQYNNLF